MGPLRSASCVGRFARWSSAAKTRARVRNRDERNACPPNQTGTRLRVLISSPGAGRRPVSLEAAGIPAVAHSPVAGGSPAAGHSPAAAHSPAEGRSLEADHSRAAARKLAAARNSPTVAAWAARNTLVGRSPGAAHNSPAGDHDKPMVALPLLPRWQAATWPRRKRRGKGRLLGRGRHGRRDSGGANPRMPGSKAQWQARPPRRCPAEI
jgi:hypothetical protein